jgi:hypothetical protein
MLTKSNKSRLAAMALMALGVTTLMGTSAALATSPDVTVSGTVGCTASFTTLSAAAHPGMGTIARDASKTVDLTFSVTQGKQDTCEDKTGGTVTAAMGTTTGSADAGESFPVTLALGSVGTVNPSTGVGLIPVTAAVPSGASTGAFGATVTLTLVDGS